MAGVKAAALREGGDDSPGKSSRSFAPPFAARALLIDLDGTIIDTAADLACAVNLMLRGLGRPPLPVATVRTFIGSGVRELVRRSLAATSVGHREADSDRSFEAFMDHYAGHLLRASRPYGGVAETLGRLRAERRKLACVTNKIEVFTDRLLKALGLAPLFDLVVSGDTLARKKPDPMPLLHVCEVFGVAPAQSLFVGDSVTDTESARRAGMPAVCVTYGYRGDTSTGDLGADALIDSFPQLLRLLAPL